MRTIRNYYKKMSNEINDLNSIINNVKDSSLIKSTTYTFCTDKTVVDKEFLVIGNTPRHVSKQNGVGGTKNFGEQNG